MSKTKLKSYTLRATVPVGQYANIIPEIVIEAETLEEAHDMAVPYMSKLFEQCSDSDIKYLNKVDGTTCPILLLESFNEDVKVEFDEITHTYTYKGGVLKSGSVIAGEYVKPFNSELLSKKCSDNWGVDQRDIQNLWKTNGATAADFGKSIHAALEQYFRYQAIGETILEKSKKEYNAALPKHPLLRGIIEDFIKVDEFEGESLPEVFVTDITGMYCGMIDKLLIIDREKKICRVQDYKVIDDVNKRGDKLLKEYKDLPPTKLSQYQIQLSVYANLLEKSGWKVEALDIFAYTGDGWKLNTLEVLKVI